MIGTATVRKKTMVKSEEIRMLNVYCYNIIIKMHKRS